MAAPTAPGAPGAPGATGALQLVRAALNSTKYSSMTIVLGNVSCDLDSAVCSLVYALYLHWQHEALKRRVCTRKHRPNNELYEDDVFVPILNMRREDYELKTEVSYCFRQQNLAANDLVFRDDFDFENLSKLKDTKVILVDHHILAPQDSFLEPLVTEILDHRPRDESNWSYSQQLRTSIEMVGSCCTLVCSRIRATENGDNFFKSYPACSELLYNTIILDTVNFSKQVNKGTPHDETVVAYLEDLLGVKDAETNRAATLDRLMHARSDVSKLTAAQLLRKDVKVVGSILVPSFPIPVQEVLSRVDCGGALVSELGRNKCALCVLLGMRLRGDRVERDLAVYGMDGHSEAAKKLANLLEQWTEPCLQLVALPTELSNCQYYQQNNLSASRKQVMPVVADFISRRK